MVVTVNGQNGSSVPKLAMEANSFASDVVILQDHWEKENIATPMQQHRHSYVIHSVVMVCYQYPFKIDLLVIILVYFP